MTYTPGVPQHAVYGYGGAVSAGSPLAATTGLDVLRSGGNAVDSVVAAAYVQSVVEFPWGGIGGDAFVLVRTPEGEVLVMNGSGTAPIKLGTQLADGDTIARFGAMSVSVPGFVAATEALHSRCGSKPFADLMAPAVAYAEEGFAVTPEIDSACRRIVGVLDVDSGLRALIEENRPDVGRRFRQPRLAQTLRGVADGGAAWFSKVVGECLSSFIGRRGGVLSPDDFAALDVAWTAPVSTRYGSVDVHTHPPVSLGGVLLHELALYGRLGLEYRDPDDPDRIDAMVRCKHAAFARWALATRDPALHDTRDLSDVAAFQEALLDEAALDEIADRLMATPIPELRSDPPAGDGSDTTCVVAADRDGYHAAVIHSLFNEFGSRELDAETGVLLNDRLANQRYSRDGIGGLRGGQRPQHTLNAVYVEGDGRPTMILATPGGRGQVQTSFQVIVNAHDGGLDPQQAIDAPRWLSGAPRRPEPNDHLYLEPALPLELRASLAARGHRTADPDDVSSDLFGSCVAVGRSVQGALYAAADHRREARTGSF